MYFGQPADAEADSIGFMPFTWMQDGAKISVHPILYELERAKGIRKLYENLMRGLGFAATNPYGGYPNAYGRYPTDPTQLIKLYSQTWNSWNRALTANYEKPDDVLFKDRFGRLLKKLRAGKIQGKDNNLETAKGQAQGWLAEKWDDLSDSTKSAAKWGAALAVGTAIAGPVGTLVVGGAFLASKVVGAAIDAGKKVAKDVGRTFDYDKGLKDLEYKEGDSWWERRKKDAKRLKRKAQAAATVAQWRTTPGPGFTYGDVRDFWLDSGALDLFKNNTIMGTTGVAIPLIDFLIGKNMLPKAPKARNANRIHDLMHWFYKMAGIEGYDWKQVVGDEPSQAGFAQVFLEYLRYKVLP